MFRVRKDFGCFGIGVFLEGLGWVFKFFFMVRKGAGEGFGDKKKGLFI